MNQEDAKHALRVLRLTPGDTVELICPPNRALADIISIENHDVLLEITRLLPSTEAATRITLYQGLPKADKMEWIVQKGTELGCRRFVPVSMKRSIVQMDQKDGERKTERWQKIVREAVKQSGRCEIPEVMRPVSFTKAVSMFEEEDILLVPWEDEHALSFNAGLSDAVKGARIGILIGPEGGIDSDEIEELRPLSNVRIVTLGPRIMRTETAALASVAAVSCRLGEWQ